MQKCLPATTALALRPGGPIESRWPGRGEPFQAAAYSGLAWPRRGASPLGRRRGGRVKTIVRGRRPGPRGLASVAVCLYRQNELIHLAVDRPIHLSVLV
jgi:hypothetical protein